MAPELPGSAWRALAELAGELTELPVGDGEGLLEHALGRLREIVHARDSYIALATRREPTSSDPLFGWRIARIIRQNETAEGEALRAAWMRETKNYVFDPFIQGIAGGAGADRTHRRRDIVEDATWQRAPIVDAVLTKLDVADSLVGTHAISPEVEVHIGMQRGSGEGLFLPRERDLIAGAVSTLGWVWRRTARAHGLLGASQQLSPRERQVLALLLGGQSEKSIASTLGLTDQSLHQYVVGLYKKLGVTSRPELMARWLNHGESATSRSERKRADRPGGHPARRTPPHQ